jgi:PAS domain S-box-containing protein
MSEKVHIRGASTKRSSVEDLVFKISKVDGIILEYFGPKHFPSENSSRKIIGSTLYSLLGLSNYQGLLKLLNTGNSPLVSYLEQEIDIEGKSYDIRLVEAGEGQILAILQDITAEIHEKEILQQSEKKFKDVFNSITDVYYKTNADRRFVIMSPSIERISGFKPELFIGKKTSYFIKETKADKIYRSLEKHGRVDDIRVNLKLPNGDLKTFSFNIEAEYDLNKNIIGTNGIIRDITKQELFEQEVIKSEKKFKEIFESISDIYYRSDENAVVQIISPSVEQITGYKPEEVLGKAEKVFHHNPDVHDSMLSYLKETGNIKNVHGELITKNKKIINVSVTSTAYFDAKGEYAGAHGIIRDITKQKKQSRLTRLNKDILEKVAKENDIIEILNFTCLGIEKIFPDMICSVLLYDEANDWLVSGAGPSLPKSYFEAVNEFPVGPSNCSCGTAAYTKELVIVSDIQNDPLWSSAAKIAAEANLRACWSVPILSSEQKVLGTFAVYYQDIRKPLSNELEIVQNIGNLLSVAIENNKNKTALISSEERYRMLIDNSPIGVIIHDPNRIHYANKEMLKMAKARSKTQLEGKEVLNFVPNEFRDIVRKRISTTPSNELIPRLEQKFLCVDGSLIDVEVVGIPLNIEGKTLIQSIFIDITERKLIQEKQRKLNEHLFKQNKQLEEFAHIASHNLRAPIANIHSLLSIYETDDSPATSKFVIDQLMVSSQNLNETIDELTEVIKTSWELNKKKQKLSFSKTLEKVKQGISSEIVSKTASIKENFVELDEIEYPKVYLESILQNLLSNSLKYSGDKRKPKIEISTHLLNNDAVLVFKDNGLGIDLKKYSDKVFGLRKTFHQNDDARGVGLFITKAQIESMGGEIKVESVVDKGTIFTVNFGRVKIAERK